VRHPFTRDEKRAVRLLRQCGPLSEAQSRSGSTRVDFEALRHSSRHSLQYSSAVQFIQIQTMPRAAAPRRRPSTRGPRSGRQASKWVRKNAALEEVAFRHGLVEGMRALKQAGGLADLFDER